jgi:hypothetical protein
MEVARVRDGEIASFEDFAEQCMTKYVQYKLPLPLGDFTRDQLNKIYSCSAKTHMKALRQELAEIKLKTEAELWALRVKETQALIKGMQRDLKKQMQAGRRLENMLEQVKLFQPPTSRHHDFKGLMVRSLQAGLSHHNLHRESVQEHMRELLRSVKGGMPKNYKKTLIESQKSKIAFAKQDFLKSLEDGRTWCKELLQSIGRWE